jgi:HK97 gp10 family phage protein
MSDTVTVEIKGLDDLQRRLAALPTEVTRPILQDVLREAGNEVKAAFVAGAPHDTGFLAEHFRVRVSVKKEDVQGAAFIGTQPHADYPDRDGGFRAKLSKALGKMSVGRISVSSVARYLEFGTRKMAANPFMSRAWESVKDNVLDKIVNGIRDALQRVGAQ